MLRTDQEILLDAINKSIGRAVAPSAAILINDTSLHAGPFTAFTVLADATIDISACDVSFIVDADVDFLVSTGITLQGNFTSLALTGGSIIAYKL